MFHLGLPGRDVRYFETNPRKERQLEGIAKAKAAGVYKGRPASIDPAQTQQLKAEGMGPSQTAKHGLKRGAKACRGNVVCENDPEGVAFEYEVL